MLRRESKVTDRKKEMKPSKKTKPAQKREHRIEGRVREARTGETLEGLRVLAFRSGTRRTHLLGSALTDEDGEFSLVLDKAALKERQKPSIDLVVALDVEPKRMKKFKSHSVVIPPNKWRAGKSFIIKNYVAEIPIAIFEYLKYWTACIPITGHVYKELPGGERCPVWGAEVCAYDVVRPLVCPPIHICQRFPWVCDPYIIEKLKGLPEPKLLEEIERIGKIVWPIPKPGPPPPVVGHREEIHHSSHYSPCGSSSSASSTVASLLKVEAVIEKTALRAVLDALLGPIVKKVKVGCDITDENGYFSICAPRFRVFKLCYDNYYDIIFKVTQRGATIYREDTGSAKKLPWGGLKVELVTTAEEAVCASPSPSGLCLADNGYMFWGVGRLSCAEIVNGYATSSDPAINADHSPFYGRIDIKACFSDSPPHDFTTGQYYYQVRYTAMTPSETTAPPDTGMRYKPIDDELWNIYTQADVASGTGPTTVSPLTMANQTTGQPESGLYKIDNSLILNTNTAGLVMRLHTNRKIGVIDKYQDGKYAFRIKIFRKVSATEVVEETGITDAPALILIFDNTPPVAKLKKLEEILKGNAPGTCPTAKTIDIETISGCPVFNRKCVEKVNIIFDATDEKHFDNYLLRYFTKHNLWNDIASETYPPDTGFPNKNVEWDISGLDPCAYQLRLYVWDRRHNGYYHSGWIEDTFHLTIIDAPPSTSFA